MTFSGETYIPVIFPRCAVAILLILIRRVLQDTRTFVEREISFPPTSLQIPSEKVLSFQLRKKSAESANDYVLLVSTNTHRQNPDIGSMYHKYSRLSYHLPIIFIKSILRKFRFHVLFLSSSLYLPPSNLFSRFYQLFSFINMTFLQQQKAFVLPAIIYRISGFVMTELAFFLRNVRKRAESARR